MKSLIWRFFFGLLFFVVVCEIRPVPAEQDIVHPGNDPSAVNLHNDDERSFVITLDFRGPSTSDLDMTFYSSLRESVASALNKMVLDSAAVDGHHVRPGRLEGSGKSKWEYTMEDVAVVGVSPVPATLANIRITLRVNRKGGQLSSADDVRDAIHREEKSISNEVGRPLLSVSQGLWSTGRGRRLPRADDSTPTKPENNIWEAHRWLFIAILIFIGFSILLTILCCICLQCRRRSSARNKAKEEIKEEPTQVVSASPGLMQEQSPPNEPPPIDEENGWIIPLDQMTKEELEQPEVQVSRL